MIALLVSGRRLQRKDLVQRLKTTDRYIAANFSEARLNAVVGDVIGLYTQDFYRDPGDKRISLTLSRMKQERERLAERKNGRDAKPTRGIVGTTAVGRIADALEAAEG